VFSPDRSLSREILFLSTNFLSAQSPFEDGIREVSFLPRFVPIKPCVERASACQARACTGAKGFIHSEELDTVHTGISTNDLHWCIRSNQFLLHPSGYPPMLLHEPQIHL